MTLRQIASRAGVALGWLALGLFLLLASPGVRVARADDAEFERFARFAREQAAQQGAPESAAAGDACAARTGREQRAAAAEWMRHVQQLAAARMRPGTPAIEMGGGVLLLNNRGYNYGPGPLADAAQLEADLRLR